LPLAVKSNSSNATAFVRNASGKTYSVKPNPLRSSIKGVICGVRIEEIKEPTMREIPYLDKLIDELAKGKPLERILRT
jgi:hypothetical protein